MKKKEYIGERDNKFEFTATFKNGGKNYIDSDKSKCLVLVGK